MNNGQIKDLCLRLLQAETEDQVVEVLEEAGYWDDPKVWRYYGDVENNWGQGGNQQSLAEAALAEKIVNSVDARLINECLVRGIDPKSDKAPRSIRQAVARFFDASEGKKDATGGYIEDWGDDKIREVAQGITLCATGTRPILNLVITDCGEGQTPRRLPLTILSLNRSNKMYIPFVQGQFNQGGTGALRFCGGRNLQLVISRRNPALVGTDPDEEDKHWGFTIVRRERPGESSDGRRNSIYTFLAPVVVGKAHEPRHGEILSFSAASMPLFPDKDSPYGREAIFGTAIKLFEYQYIGEKSNIIRGKSVILRRLELLLPEIALPVRLYEFRKNAAGKILPQGSRETTLVGLRRRLIDNENVEAGFPISINFAPRGEKLIADVFVFKPEGSERDDEEDDEDTNGKDKKKLGGIRTYRKREGVVFVRNGQTQGHLPRDFFKRDALKMKPLADDMLVFVDCNQLSDDVREDLFMPSRDRLTDNAFKADLIDGLEQAIKMDETLRLLRNKRQQERMSEKLKDDRPLTDVLQALIKSSPNLTQLLQFGQRISAPFNTLPTGAGQEKEFKGEIYPTFFKLKGIEYGKLYKRNCPINHRMKLTFETDARDDYFLRRIERGNFSLVHVDKLGAEVDASYVGPNLKSGIATVMASLPEDIEVGDLLTYIGHVEDTRASFENRVEVTVKPAAEHHGGGHGERKPPQPKPGHEREIPRQLATPHIERVYREQWEGQNPPFDEFTAMRVEVTGYEGEEENEVYEFKINMDNTPLLNEIKQRRLDDVPARNQFLYGNVLVGLSMLLQDKQSGESPQNGNGEYKLPPIEVRIEAACGALAPFMLALTSLGLSDLADVEEVEGLESATG
jgi:hypothetical protein